MKEKTRILPIFISFQGCPHHCIYCNQEKITGVQDMTPAKALRELKEGLKGGTPLELAFYGGTFTSLDQDLQEAYFSIAEPFLGKEVTGIRFSTRPDAIDRDWLVQLKAKGLKKVELGCQSLDEEVLKKAGRGHSLKDIENACRQVKEAGLELGVQQMLGLPGEDFHSFQESLEKIMQLQPDFVRLYPTLVLRDTGLEKLYERGAYSPLSLEEAVDWAAYALSAYQSRGIPVIRTGLQASEEISKDRDLVAGPYHPSFGQMAKTRFMVQAILKLLKDGEEILEITGPGQAISNLVGQHKSGRKILEEGQGPICFKSGEGTCLEIVTECRRIVLGEKQLCI